MAFLSPLSTKKQFSIFPPQAKALIHSGKKLWFSVFKGKGKGEETNVLKEGKEGKEAFLFGLLHSHGKGEEGKGGADHHIGTKGSREVRERGQREEALFQIRADGKSWVYKNIVLVNSGTSNYTVYIKGLREGWEEEDAIICYVPNQLAMFDLLYYLLQGQYPVFSSWIMNSGTQIDNYKPI